MGDKERVRESLLVDGRQVVPEAMAARLQRAQATEAGQAAGSVKASSPVWAVLVWTGPGPGLALLAFVACGPKLSVYVWGWGLALSWGILRFKFGTHSRLCIGLG